MVAGRASTLSDHRAASLRADDRAKCGRRGEASAKAPDMKIGVMCIMMSILHMAIGHSWRWRRSAASSMSSQAAAPYINVNQCNE